MVLVPLPQIIKNLLKKRQQDRIKIFETAIAEPKIVSPKILELAFEGIPESNSLRSTYWKLLLGYLPAEKGKWDEVTRKKRATYKDWVQELIIDPHDKQAKGDASHPQEAGDHPLSQAVDSNWHTFFKDKNC